MRRPSIGRLIGMAILGAIVSLLSIDTTMACRFLLRTRCCEPCAPIQACPTACPPVVTCPTTSPSPCGTVAPCAAANCGGVAWESAAVPASSCCGGEVIVSEGSISSESPATMSETPMAPVETAPEVHEPTPAATPHPAASHGEPTKASEPTPAAESKHAEPPKTEEAAPADDSGLPGDEPAATEEPAAEEPAADEPAAVDEPAIVDPAADEPAAEAGDDPLGTGAAEESPLPGDEPAEAAPADEDPAGDTKEGGAKEGETKEGDDELKDLFSEHNTKTDTHNAAHEAHGGHAAPNKESAKESVKDKAHHATAPAAHHGAEANTAEPIDEFSEESAPAHTSHDVDHAPGKADGHEATVEESEHGSETEDHKPADEIEDLFGKQGQPKSKPHAEHTSETKPVETPAKANLEFRTWTDNTGHFQTVARLVKVTDTHVRLLKDSGRYTTVDKARLSLADLEYLEEVVKQFGTTTFDQVAQR